MTVRSALDALKIGAAEGQGETSGADPYEMSRAIIADFHRIVTPDGIQENLEVTLGGARQTVNIRGSSVKNPILLYVHGGPGTSATPFAWTFQRPWEDFFIVVNWDQRGAGASFALEASAKIASTMTFDQICSDAIELIVWLKTRFDGREVILMGDSWGTAIGLAVSAARPDLLHAYVGISQIIDFRRAEQANFAWTLERARNLDDAHAICELEALEPYPGTGPFDPEKALVLRKWTGLFGGMAANRTDLGFWFQSVVLSPVYGPEEMKAWYAGQLFSAEHLAPTLINLEFNGITRLDVPVVLLHGRNDRLCAFSLVESWIEALVAPTKLLIPFENSAHFPHIEQPGRVLHALLQHIPKLRVLASA